MNSRSAPQGSIKRILTRQLWSEATTAAILCAFESLFLLVMGYIATFGGGDRVLGVLALLTGTSLVIAMVGLICGRHHWRYPAVAMLVGSALIWGFYGWKLNLLSFSFFAALAYLLWSCDSATHAGAPANA